MKLYVGTYGKYNDGSLFGEWLDLDDYETKEDFLKACYELHKDEKDAELMFQDFEAENSLEEKFYSECSISADYWEYKEALKNSCLDAEAVGNYINEISETDLIKGIEKAENAYFGTYEDTSSFIDEVIDEYIKDLPGWISCHIDYSGIERDLGFDYYFLEDSEGNTAVFSRY